MSAACDLFFSLTPSPSHGLGKRSGRCGAPLMLLETDFLFRHSSRVGSAHIHIAAIAMKRLPRLSWHERKWVFVCNRMMEVENIPYRHGGSPGRDRQDNTIPEAGWERRINVSHGTRILSCIAKEA